MTDTRLRGSRAGARATIHTPYLTTGTRVATALAVCVAQVGLAIPAVLNGLFQQDLHTNSSQLTWISDAFLVPVALLEVTWGVLGDLFGRKRLLVGGSLLMAVGELISVLTPSPGTSNTAAVATLWVGQALTGIGAAVLFPPPWRWSPPARTRWPTAPGASPSGPRRSRPGASSPRSSAAWSRRSRGATTRSRPGGGRSSRSASWRWPARP